MSDQRKPDPEFNFSDIPVEDLPPIPLEFPGDPKVAEIIGAVPNHKTSKRRWWQGKPKDEKKEKTSKARKPMPAMPTGGLKTPLTQLYMGLGIAAMPFNATLAKSLMENAEACADAWVEYAKINPAVKRFLIGLCAASAAGNLIAAHMPILLAVIVSVPAFQKKQGEQMANMAELFANGHFAQKPGEEES